MTKLTDEKLVLAVAGRVDAQDEYQKCCESVAEALRKKKLAEAKFIKAKAKEAKAKEEGATQEQKAQTAKLKRQFEARVKELDCAFDGEYCVDAPSGKVFAEGVHHLVVCPGDSMTADDYLDALSRMEDGLMDCEDPECDCCHPEDDTAGMVTCSLCHAKTPEATAHLHQGEWIGDECWDVRLKASE